MFKLAHKNSLFGNLSGLFLKKKLLHFESALSNLSNCQILEKNKNAYTWDQTFIIYAFFGSSF